MTIERTVTQLDAKMVRYVCDNASSALQRYRIGPNDQQRIVEQILGGNTGWWTIYSLNGSQASEISTEVLRVKEQYKP
ncbi:MAG TPA: hypothetical protein VI564_05930 [Candidatus Nanoarchaeia archaeon]|nr:hypothetical protein [Candidatus Nanoarchaeia archaeon]